MAVARIYDRGIWEDEHGGLHFEIPQLLKRLGLKNTPENVELMTKCVQEELASLAPKAKIEVAD